MQVPPFARDRKGKGIGKSVVNNMTPISFQDVTDLYPHLVEQVIRKLGQNRKDRHPTRIAWSLVTCHDDPEQPLNEAAAADLLRTGGLTGRHGVCGRIGRHFACYCDEGCVPAERLARIPL